MSGKKYKRPSYWWEPWLYMLVMLLFISAIVAIDIFRWQVFQDATDSDVSYWKWRLWIDTKR